MPRAPKGYKTINGKIYENGPPKPAAVCPYSGHPVTGAQRKRRARDCPKCGAPDITWIEPGGQNYAELGKLHTYLNTATWGRHAPGTSNTAPALFTLDGNGRLNNELPTNTGSDKAPF